uniref:MRN complex-interacting protein N-terminal domain-containing protein n=1 Tax=Echeneis naucrates TaxID=173247 RepID=A0A665TX25_ECHNA
NRWSCKVCGQKQSLLKEFGRGSGADCRRHVQRLNAMRGAMIEEHEKQVETVGEEQHDDQVKKHTNARARTHTRLVFSVMMILVSMHPASLPTHTPTLSY